MGNDFFGKIENKIGIKLTFWLRWFIFIPVSIVAMVLASIFLKYLEWYNIENETFLFKIPYIALFFKSVRNGLVQAVFVFVSLWMIPKFKYIICYIYIILHFLLILASFALMIITIVKFSKYEISTFIFNTIGMSVSLILCFYMKNKIKVYGDISIDT